MSELAANLSPIPLMQIATGFWASKTLAAATELNLFTRLSGTAGTTIEELAQALAVQPRPAEMLLTGCAALGLLEKQSDRYRNSKPIRSIVVTSGSVASTYQTTGCRSC